MPPFQVKISSEQLVKGLRPFKRIPKDSGYLVESAGAVGRNGVLQAIDTLTRMNTDVITDGFPYPQIFVFTNLIIVCSAKRIYEFTSGGLIEKLTVTAGSTWTAVDFYNFVYLTNAKVSVTRSATTGAYSSSAILTAGMSLCNFNGQVLVGAPETKYLLVTDLTINAEILGVTLTCVPPALMLELGLLTTEDLFDLITESGDYLRMELTVIGV